MCASYAALNTDQEKNRIKNMQKYHTTIAQYKNIMRSLVHIGMVVCSAWMFFMILSLPGTNAFFTDQATIGQITFQAGTWISTLTMTVTPELPDGDDGVYTKAPCVKFFTDIDDVTIHYVFDGMQKIEGVVEKNACVFPPDGESILTAYAVNHANDNWISDTITREFTVSDAVRPGSIVINEIMWMGSLDNDRDEWIELRNMTDQEVDLSHWRIQHGGKGKNSHIEIPNGYSIRANGYFLIVAEKASDTAILIGDDLGKDQGYLHVSGMDLSDSGEKLVLAERSGIAIDTVWKNALWPDGWHGIYLHMSMERNDEPGDGTKAVNWHTCTAHNCNDREYWKEEGVNFGTPGHTNTTKRVFFERDCSACEGRAMDDLKDDNDIIKNIWRDHFGTHDPDIKEKIKDTIQEVEEVFVDNAPDPVEQDKKDGETEQVIVEEKFDDPVIDETVEEQGEDDEEKMKESDVAETKESGNTSDGEE